MTNAYADRTTLKSRLGITGTGDDTTLRQLLESTSRVIDKWCRRWFYVKSDTRYYPGALKQLWVTDDLLVITTIKLDFDSDGTFEETMAATDYFLMPHNDFPKNYLELNPQGNYSTFAKNQPKGVEIVGFFGYGTGLTATPYVTSTTTTNEALDISETGVDVVDGTQIKPGQTILVESEQMYVTEVAANTLTVQRGVNGTTAATHDTAKTVFVYEYPKAVSEACIMTAAKFWKRRDSAFGTVIGFPEFGGVEIIRGMDPDVKDLLSPYAALARMYA